MGCPSQLHLVMTHEIWNNKEIIESKHSVLYLYIYNLRSIYYISTIKLPNSDTFI